MTRSELDNLKRLHEAAGSGSPIDRYNFTHAMLAAAPALIAMAEDRLKHDGVKITRCGCIASCQLHRATLPNGEFLYLSPAWTNATWMKLLPMDGFVPDSCLRDDDAAAFLAQHPIPSEVSK